MELISAVKHESYNKSLFFVLRIPIALEIKNMTWIRQSFHTDTQDTFSIYVKTLFNDKYTIFSCWFFLLHCLYARDNKLNCSKLSEHFIYVN